MVSTEEKCEKEMVKTPKQLNSTMRQNDSAYTLCLQSEQFQEILLKWRMQTVLSPAFRKRNKKKLKHKLKVSAAGWIHHEVPHLQRHKTKGLHGSGTIIST